jgi:hypothetical protein
VLLILTIGLVLVGAVSLVIGFVSQNTAPIYISIVCSVAAGLVLVVFSRLNRRQAVATGSAAPADATGPTTTEYVLDQARAAARPASTPAADDGFPIEDYDQLLVSEIVPLLPELDLEELDQVRAREEDGKARASILRRIDALAAELEAGGAVAVAVADDDDEVEDEATMAAPAVDYDDEEDDDELFPIADYDDLRVNQVLPLLPELDDDELEVVAARERAGAGRYSILVRIDELLGNAPPAAPAPRKAPAKKAAAKKTAVKKAATKKAAAPKKAAPKKAAAKKTAAKKTAAKKTAAKKSS